MGGNERNIPRKTSAKDRKESVDDWLQEVIDVLAYEYGWSKAEIFDMYPMEIEILMRKASKRREADDDMRQYKAAIAACVPHMKDGGKEYLNSLVNKYKRFDDGSTITKEDIDRNTKIAKSVLGM